MPMTLAVLTFLFIHEQSRPTLSNEQLETGLLNNECGVQSLNPPQIMSFYKAILQDKKKKLKKEKKQRKNQS